MAPGGDKHLGPLKACGKSVRFRVRDSLFQLDEVF